MSAWRITALLRLADGTDRIEDLGVHEAATSDKARDKARALHASRLGWRRTRNGWAMGGRWRFRRTLSCPPLCQCDDCTIARGRVHAEADAACGREWTCQCGGCKRAREINIHRAFAKLEETESKLATIKKIKAL